MKSEVHNIDCLELMRTLPDKCFQLAIADPPYGGAGNEQFEGRGSRFGQRFDRYKQANISNSTAPTRKTVCSSTEKLPPPQQLNHASGGRFERYEGAGVKCIDWDVAPKQEFFD